MRRWILAVCLASCTASGEAGRRVHRYDVVVYGGTAGGLVSAVAASEEGVRAVVLEPTGHLGGMVTGGLGWTDKGVEGSVGGMSRAFYRRAYAWYERPEAWKYQTREEYLRQAGGMVNPKDRVWWAVEPSVASALLGRMIEGAGVAVRRRHRIAFVAKKGNRIQSLTCSNGETFVGRVFIDATYEGDLLAWAGVSYRVGREGRGEYGEELAGVVPEAWSTRKQWDVDIRPYGPDGKLLAGVQAGPRGADGEGDRKVQAYNFRVCLTDHPDNLVPVARPPGYDPSRYDLLALYLAARGRDLNWAGRKGKGLLTVSPLPNRKADVNDGAPFSTDHVGASWGYPEGDEAARRRIFEDHVEYTRGLLHFLGHDERVPPHVREEARRWGVPKDEFSDGAHWPPQLYVREARRLAGAYVMTQHDIHERREKEDSIGMGSYNADSHHVQRIVDARGHVRNEGNPNDRAVGHKPYEISYRSVVPRREECDNLLVTFCVSASHVAFASLRMEPVFMVLSESCGAAAARAARGGVAVQDVPLKPLQERLAERGQRLRLDGLGR